MYIRLLRADNHLPHAKEGDICQVSRQLGTRLVTWRLAEAVSPDVVLAAQQVVPEKEQHDPVPIVIPVGPTETQEAPKRRYSRKKKTTE